MSFPNFEKRVRAKWSVQAPTPRVQQMQLRAGGEYTGILALLEPRRFGQQ